MPIAPPVDSLLDQPPINLMDLFGRMRSLTDQAGFSGTLPAIWQCSDESQSIKKALFGYVYGYPSFNLGRVGALLDPTRLATAAKHGKDLVIFGGSHISANETSGVGYIERVNGQIAPCCGMLARILNDYLPVYRRATKLIKVFFADNSYRIKIPYKYLFEKPTREVARIQINIAALTKGEALGEGTQGKIYQLHPQIIKQYHAALQQVEETPQPIGRLLKAEFFSFKKQLNDKSHEPKNMLEVSLFDYIPEVVATKNPHKRLCNINTWRQFHRIASYITDQFDGNERNVFVLAGLTIDHSIRHNTIIPQFGFWMKRGKALEAEYFGANEINQLIGEQEIYRPPVTFLEYAGL